MIEREISRQEFARCIEAGIEGAAGAAEKWGPVGALPDKQKGQLREIGRTAPKALARTMHEGECECPGQMVRDSGHPFNMWFAWAYDDAVIEALGLDAAILDSEAVRLTVVDP